MTADLKVSGLFIHPLKGGRARALNEMTIEARGPAGDRRWVATDADGVFLTQRECSALAQITAIPAPQVLRLEKEGLEALDVAGRGGARGRIRVWKDDVDAVSAGDAADFWLSKALGRPARLFHMDEAAARSTPTKWTTESSVSFADAYPILVTNSASLAALNDAIAGNGGAPVAMARFRPNIVVSGDAPWAEDYWRVLEIGSAVIELVKPCDRCVVTTKDPATGESLGKEPLKTLNLLRRSAHPDLNGVLFGWNAVVKSMGPVRIGDVVRVAENRPEGFPIARQ